MSKAKTLLIASLLLLIATFLTHLQTSEGKALINPSLIRQQSQPQIQEQIKTIQDDYEDKILKIDKKILTIRNKIDTLTESTLTDTSLNTLKQETHNYIKQKAKRDILQFETLIQLGETITTSDQDLKKYKPTIKQFLNQRVFT